MGQSESSPTVQEPASRLPTRQAVPEDSRKHFIYEALANPRHIRILRLKRSRRDRKSPPSDSRSFALCGSIVEISLDRPFDYYALSYTWGDSSLCDTITIDGQELGITGNCADALRCMLKDRKEMPIWVDSICINQASDLQALRERDGQVAMMGEIYSKAGQVNVFLGLGDEKSDIAVQAVKDLFAALVPAMMAKLNGSTDRTAADHYDYIADDVTTLTPEFPYGKLHGMFRLPWFRRVWVFQEVVLSQKAIFYCGDHALDMDQIVAVADFTRVPFSRMRPGLNYYKTFLGHHQGVRHLIQQRSHRGNATVSILDFVTSQLTLEASRPEDKIFGMYACAKRLGLDLPAPDHTKKVAEVYTGAMVACLCQSGNLGVLGYVEGAAAGEFDLPSWVVNFSGSFLKWGPESFPKSNKPFGHSKMTGPTSCEWTYLPDTRQLVVLGRRLDQIAAVSEPWAFDSSQTLLCNATEAGGQRVSSLLEAIPSWIEIARQRIHETDQRTMLEVEAIAARHLADLFIAGRKSAMGPMEEHHGLPGALAENFAALAFCARAPDDLYRSYLGRGDEYDDLSTWIPFGDGVYLSKPMAQTVMYLHPFPWRLVFRTTSLGFLGIGGYSVCPGDLMVSLRGMGGICILRPCAEGFTFVSTGFVDDFDEDEFWQTGSDSDNEWFVLT